MLRRRRNGGEVKYKIINVDEKEFVCWLLDRKIFFQWKLPYTSCAVILTKFHNNTIEQYSIVDKKASANENEEDKKSEESDGSIDKIDNSKDIAAAIETNYSSYRYTSKDIDKFYASDNGQAEEHSLEDSICRLLIGKQIHKPFFLYCKICPKVEFLQLKSIEDHIRLKDPERHKAKLLDLLERRWSNSLLKYYKFKIKLVLDIFN